MASPNTLPGAHLYPMLVLMAVVYFGSHKLLTDVGRNQRTHTGCFCSSPDMTRHIYSWPSFLSVVCQPRSGRTGSVYVNDTLHLNKRNELLIFVNESGSVNCIPSVPAPLFFDNQGRREDKPTYASFLLQSPKTLSLASMQGRHPARGASERSPLDRMHHSRFHPPLPSLRPPSNSPPPNKKHLLCHPRRPFPKNSSAVARAADPQPGGGQVGGFWCDQWAEPGGGGRGAAGGG